MIRNFGLLFWINALLFLLFGINTFFQVTHHPFGHYFSSLVLLTIIFFLPAQNTTALLERVFKKQFTFTEKLAVIAALGFIISPFSLSLFGHSANPSFFATATTVGITVFSWLLAVAYTPFFWESTPSEKINTPVGPAVTIAVLVMAMFLFQLTTAYYALPDLDPYYWLQQFQNKFASPTNLSLQEHRPLFFSFGYLFIEIAQVDAYAFFKYIIPFLFLSILFPAVLVADKARHLLEALLIFFLPLASASFILYSTSSLPQSIANILIVSAFYTLIYAANTQKGFFFLLGGFLLFTSTFYHEVGLLFFLPWLFILLLSSYRQIIIFIRQEKLSSLLLLILLLISLKTFSPYLAFLSGWIEKVSLTLLHFQPNFTFPATYINIDGNAVGWGDITGVLRYYAFYFGPFASLILLSLLTVSLFRKKPFWYQTLDHPLEKQVFAYYTVTLILFFSIAEFLPRFFNISLLPERALGFVACIVAFFFGYLLLKRSARTIHILILLIAISINIGAALYVNSIKQYLITTNQIASAEWIRGTLPKDKVIFTTAQVNLLRFHAQADTIVSIDDPSFYTDIRVFEKSLSRIPSATERYQEDYIQVLQNLGDQFALLENTNPDTSSDSVSAILDTITQDIQSFRNQYPDRESRIVTDIHLPIYIYYSKENSKNPYAHRPYMKQVNQHATTLIFDQFPDRFERVYNLPDNEIVIWKVIH